MSESHNSSRIPEQRQGSPDGQVDIGAALLDIVGMDEQTEARNARIADNFSQHIQGELPDAMRVLDADMVGLSEDIARRNRERLLSDINGRPKGIIRRAFRRLVGQ